MMSILARVIVAIAGLSMWSAQALAWDELAKTEAAFYSNLCHSLKIWYQGERLTILNSYPGYHVIYQEALTNMSPSIGLAEVWGSQISFKVQAKAGEILVFKGTITPDYIVGLFAGDSSHNRGRSEIRWLRISAEGKPPECPAAPASPAPPPAAGLREKR